MHFLPRCYYSHHAPLLSVGLICSSGVSPGSHPWLQNDKALSLQCTQNFRGLVSTKADSLPRNQFWLHSTHCPSLVSGTHCILPPLELSPHLSIFLMRQGTHRLGNYAFHSAFSPAHRVMPEILQVLIKGNQMGLGPELASCFQGFSDSQFSSLSSHYQLVSISVWCISDSPMSPESRNCGVISFHLYSHPGREVLLPSLICRWGNKPQDV